MNFWVIFAACCAANLVFGMIGFCFGVWGKKVEKETEEEIEKTRGKLAEYQERVTKQVNELEFKRWSMIHEDRLMMLHDVIDIFEQFLEEKGISIENDEKKEDPYASLIYGSDYGELESGVENVLLAYGVIKNE